MTTLLVSIALAGIAAALLILASHLLVWRKPWRLTRLQAYIVGTAQIGLVITAWALATNHPETAIAYWGIAGCAGGADVVAWWFRRRLARVVDAAAEDAFQRGRIYGLDAAAEDYGDDDEEAEVEVDDAD